MQLTAFEQGIAILITLVFLMIVRYTCKKYHSLAEQTSKNSDVYVYQYLFYWSVSVLLSSLAGITASVFMIMQIYHALN